MEIKDNTELYVIHKGTLVFLYYGACPDMSVQARLAKHLNETEKPEVPYSVASIRVKDLSVRGIPPRPEVTEPKHKTDKHDRMVGIGI